VGPDSDPVAVVVTSFTPPPAAALEAGADPPAAAVVVSEFPTGVVVGVVPEAMEAGAGALSPTFTPHGPMGLLPGSLDNVPEMTSLIGLLMLQEVDGSFSPPMRPGHLSIPASPALQLLMI
jgi:hypothetical protein